MTPAQTEAKTATLYRRVMALRMSLARMGDTQ